MLVHGALRLGLAVFGVEQYPALLHTAIARGQDVIAVALVERCHGLRIGLGHHIGRAIGDVQLLKMVPDNLAKVTMSPGAPRAMKMAVGFPGRANRGSIPVMLAGSEVGLALVPRARANL